MFLFINTWKSCIESDIVKSIISVVKDVLKAHSNRVRFILEPIMMDFTSRMLQADLITDVAAKSPACEYQVIMNNFLSCLEYSTSTKEVEEECSKLLGILKAIGGPCKKASKAIRQDFVEGIKHKCDIELLLSE